MNDQQREYQQMMESAYSRNPPQTIDWLKRLAGFCANAQNADTSINRATMLQESSQWWNDLLQEDDIDIKTYMQGLEIINTSSRILSLMAESESP